MKSKTPLLDEAERINRELRKPNLTEAERAELETKRFNIGFLCNYGAVGEQAEKDAE